ncbi:MAG: 3-isopropylmalate/(R)-2-methylmalate dehydratase small subunit, partial [Betaproteobacteria bacterium]|nr:3-isopropylmalate/(R)-2-methylmalate dehydratase small subunit [Betaproteobacteria bacterium]
MKAWVFGDNIDTDAMAPGRYMKSGIAEIAKHSMEAIDARFS